MAEKVEEATQADADVKEKKSEVNLKGKWPSLQIGSKVFRCLSCRSL